MSEPPGSRDRSKSPDPIDAEAVAGLLAPGGVIGNAHPAYEDRPTQRDMTREVAAAYNAGGIRIAEAGTGTGKSIAYLLPAIRWARENDERTVVSTNTINLQQQLVAKDLPFLRRALGEPFTFALVKGRKNYISIRRAHLAIATAPALFDDKSRETELDAIGEWLKSTREGSVQELPFTPSSEVWDEVASESDICLRTKCPHFEACFYQRARRDAATADVLVVNHHLLLSDLAVRRAAGNYDARAVLPPYRRLILDEAHNLEDSATEHLGASVSRRGVERLLGRLHRKGRGVLRTVAERLEAGEDDMLQRDALRRIEDTLRPSVENARGHADELFRRLEALLIRHAPDGTLRLGRDFAGEPEWCERVEPARQNLAITLDTLATELEQLRERILLDERWTEALEEQLLELEAGAGRTRGTADALALALTPADDALPMVRWLERRGGDAENPRRGGNTRNQTRGDEGARTRSRPANVYARAAPVDLSEALRDALFERMDTTILTSATLATADGFGFLRDRLGLSAPGLAVVQETYPSPFDYETQTLVAVPTDLPAPDAPDGRFDTATARAVERLAELSDGGIFCLFTSYRALRAVASELRNRQAHGRWPLFVQGEQPRAQLLDRFTSSGRGILLGVASFWEGVDVPGEPLRGLVIAKLPFKVPTEPLTAARVEAIQAAGGNAFHEYMLPHAALRLKQGFGRLIRSRTDRGAVVLLDRRVVRMRYGRYFLESLPPAPVHAGPWSELEERLRDFYETDQRS